MAPLAFLPTRSPLPGSPSMPSHEPPRVCSPLPPTPGCTWLPVSSWSPPPMPAASTLSSYAPILPCFQATPQWLDFSNTPSPRVMSKPHGPSPRVVIESWHLLALSLLVHPTRKPIPAPLALFTAGQPLHKCVTYHIPTAKSVQPTAEPIGFAGLYKAMHPAEIDGFAFLCQALMQMSGLQALSVIDPSTDIFLKHHQLRHDLHYKATWDTSYTNELGWLY
jgi:hypothetical protein